MNEFIELSEKLALEQQYNDPDDTHAQSVAQQVYAYTHKVTSTVEHLPPITDSSSITTVNALLLAWETSYSYHQKDFLR